jgi:hypothetical protein
MRPATDRAHSSPAVSGLCLIGKGGPGGLPRLRPALSVVLEQELLWANPPQIRVKSMVLPVDSGSEGSRRRDALLLALLKTPPQPRPKRVRAKAKLPLANRNAGKPAKQASVAPK